MEINQSNTLYKTGPREGMPYSFSLKTEKTKLKYWNNQEPQANCCTSTELEIKEVYLIYS